MRLASDIKWDMTNNDYYYYYYYDYYYYDYYYYCYDYYCYIQTCGPPHASHPEGELACLIEEAPADDRGTHHTSCAMRVQTPPPLPRAHLGEQRRAAANAQPPSASAW